MDGSFGIVGEERPKESVGGRQQLVLVEDLGDDVVQIGIRGLSRRVIDCRRDRAVGASDTLVISETGCVEHVHLAEGNRDLFRDDKHLPSGHVIAHLPQPGVRACDKPTPIERQRLDIETLGRFDLGGSVAVDFPTLPNKGDRRAVDEAIGAALADWPHERTAMNGFGLVQIVARLERPSLLHLAAWQRLALVWRQLLRRAELLEGPGTLELSIHPSLERVIEPAHLAALERRAGAGVKLRKVATLLPDAPQAQRVPDD